MNVRVSHDCEGCGKRYFVTAALVPGDVAADVRHRLALAPSTCPFCDRRRGVAGDLFRGRGVRPGCTHRVSERTPSGARLPAEPPTKRFVPRVGESVSGVQLGLLGGRDG